MNNSRITFFIFFLIALVYTLFELWTPPQYDNFVFERLYLDANNNSPTFSFKAWIDYILDIRAIDNMRLGNILAPITTLMLPHWLFSVFTGLATAGFMTFAALLCCNDCRRRSAICLSLVWLLATFFLPWRDHILINDFVLNYIFASLVSLWFVFLLMPLLDGKTCSTGRFALTIIAAVLTGMWHEGFALPIACGLGLWILRRCFRVDWRLYVFLSVLLVVTLSVFLCPGMLQRTSEQFGLFVLSLKFIQLAQLLILLFAVVAAFTVTWIIPAWRNRAKQLSADPVFIVMLGASLAGSVLLTLFGKDVRVGLPLVLFSIICIGRMTMPAINAFSRRLAASVIAICIIILSAHASLTLPWIIRLDRQFNDIMNEISHIDSPYIFYDATLPDQIPLYTFRFPISTTWTNRYNYDALGFLLGRNIPVVIPTVLNTELKSNPGQPVGDAFRIGDVFYAKADATSRGNADLSFTIYLNDGTELSGCKYFAARFYDAAGDEYIYFKPFIGGSDKVAKIIF